MQRFNRTVSLALGAVVLTLGFSGFASASGIRVEQGADPYHKKIEVQYADLDLTRIADAKKLYSRLWIASRDVCRSSFGITSRASRAAESNCAAKAMDEAVASVSNANLTSVYVARTAKRPMLASSR